MPQVARCDEDEPHQGTRQVDDVDGPDDGMRLAETLFISQRRRTDGTMDATRFAVGETLGRLLDAAGLKKKGRRVLMARHSLKTLVLEASTDSVTLAEPLGHSSIVVTNAYVKANPERMMAAAEANPPAKQQGISGALDALETAG